MCSPQALYLFLFLIINIKKKLVCKASAEKKRVSWAVRQEKGNLLEGKEGVTGS